MADDQDRSPDNGGAPLSLKLDQPVQAVDLVETHVLDYVRVLARRRWTIATIVLVVVGLTAISTFTTPPTYEVRVRLLIESDRRNVVDFKEVIEERQSEPSYYQTQYNILQSRMLARRTIDALKLWDSPELGGGSKQQRSRFSIASLIGGAFATVRGRFGGAAQIQGEGREAETAAQLGAIDNFLGRLAVAPIRNSQLVDVTYRSSNPELAANVANAFARTYIEQNLEFKFLASREASDWLGERLAEQRQAVEQSEAALQHYREQNDAVSLEERQNIVVQKLADLNAAVTRAKTERIQKEAVYQQFQSIQTDRTTLDTFPAVLSNGFIQQQKAELANLQRQLAQLSQKLGERHPEMIKVRTAIQAADTKLQGEIAKVVESVRNEYLAAEAQERSLIAALEAQKNEALGLNRKGIEYGVLRRESESNRQIYESLLQRTNETGISAELKTSNIRVVDAAEQPRQPVSPRRRRDLSLALAGGLFFGIAAAFLVEYLDNRIKTPDEIKTHLGLSVLGLIPKIESDGSTALLMGNGAVSPGFDEAFRSIRTNVLFSAFEEGGKSLVVTSTCPMEGKTIVSSNLAIALAQAGYRTLLIDADMRRAKVHHVFGYPQQPGLSNLIVGGVKAVEAVRETSISSLWVLTAGVTPPNPAELLGSKRFKELLRRLGEHFEWVLVDSPPLMAVSDASIVAHVASGVVFVVGAEMTSRNTAKTALEQLRSMCAGSMGAVLNNVNLHRNPYYYSRYYRKSYAHYYTHRARS